MNCHGLSATIKDETAPWIIFLSNRVNSCIRSRKERTEFKHVRNRLFFFEGLSMNRSNIACVCSFQRSLIHSNSTRFYKRLSISLITNSQDSEIYIFSMKLRAIAGVSWKILTVSLNNIPCNGTERIRSVIKNIKCLQGGIYQFFG
jgi:hypothetical protein